MPQSGTAGLAVNVADLALNVADLAVNAAVNEVGGLQTA